VIGCGVFGLFAPEPFDETKSGRVFIEHRVQFVDLFTGSAPHESREQDDRRLPDTGIDPRRRDGEITRYGELPRVVLADRIAWFRDRSLPREISKTHGRDSLATAYDANRLAHLS